VREEKIDCELMAEIGFYGYVPRPADPFIFNYRNMPTCKMLTGIPTIMGVLMAGANSKNIGSIGAAQVDKFGNVNSTKIPGRMYFVGSGGANDICSSAREVIVTALQDKNRFVEKVAYISSPGKRVRAVVSDLGVYEKPEGSEELILTGYFPGPDRSDAESAVRHIKDNCGFELKVADDVKEIPRPELEELKMLRLFDPRRQFLGKR
jgi:acyl CoA:acetate/3-ketoacid CoA transferase beta subunit